MWFINNKRHWEVQDDKVSRFGVCFPLIDSSSVWVFMWYRANLAFWGFIRGHQPQSLALHHHGWASPKGPTCLHQLVVKCHQLTDLGSRDPQAIGNRTSSSGRGRIHHVYLFLLPHVLPFSFESSRLIRYDVYSFKIMRLLNTPPFLFSNFLKEMLTI